jgi:hypothetical protein
VLSGATVVILDGTNAGRSTTTNSFGRYTFTGLTPANANLAARMGGYLESRSGLYIDGTATLDFALRPDAPPPTPEETNPRVEISIERVAGDGNFIEYRFTATSNVSLTGYEWDLGTIKSNNNRAVQQYVYYTNADYTITVTARTVDGNRTVTASVKLEVRL